MSLIHIDGDPIENAKKKAESLLRHPIRDQQYKLGLPFHREETEVARLLALHPAVAKVAAKQLQAKWERQISEGRLRKEELTQQLQCMQGVLEWIESNPSMRLQRNDCSRLHKLKEAIKAGLLIGEGAEPADKDGAMSSIQNTFLVQHDWRTAFENSEGLSDDFRLPYEVCSFEFRIGGRTLIAACAEVDGKARFTVLIEAEPCWYPLCSDGEVRKDMLEGILATYVFANIQALCIALDAEVATHTVVRASVPLNEKRLKSGKIPLADYHVVDLARRHRVGNPSRSEPTGRRVRLHFRRGHWRHYDDHKTWIKWMLVGNPDLGFIQKHYSL